MKKNHYILLALIALSYASFGQIKLKAYNTQSADDGNFIANGGNSQSMFPRHKTGNVASSNNAIFRDTASNPNEARLAHVFDLSLTVDGNDVLTSNSKIVAYSANGQSFFTGHQYGGGYSYPDGIFRAMSDNTNGAANYFYDGVISNGSGGWSTKFSVRADGQAFFAGNVGIGQTASAIYKLEASGLFSSSMNGQAGLHIYNGGAQAEWLVQQKSQTDHNFNISKLVSGVQNDYLTIDLYGSVGIGTPAPQGTLEVKSASQFDPRTELRITNNAYDYGRANFVITGRIENGNDAWQFGTLARNSIVFAENAANSGQNVGAVGDEKFSIQLEGNSNSLGFLSKQNGNTPNMIMAQNGNIGIGTTDNALWQLANSTTYKLAVGGNMIAEQVVVKLQSNWPDFVFKPAYSLPSLSSVKTFIDQNHHLPEIPSAADVEKDGLNLGEMNKLLLKKVEELTLYLIEQQKEIDLLKKKNAKQIMDIYNHLNQNKPFR